MCVNRLQKQIRAASQDSDVLLTDLQESGSAKATAEEAEDGERVISELMSIRKPVTTVPADDGSKSDPELAIEMIAFWRAECKRLTEENAELWDKLIATVKS